MPVVELYKFLESPLPTNLPAKGSRLNPDIFTFEDSCNRRYCCIKISPLPAKIPEKDVKKVLFGLTANNDPKYRGLQGIYHDAKNNCLVASDAAVLMAIPEEGIDRTWIEAPDGTELEAEYPAWQSLIPNSGYSYEIKNADGEIITKLTPAPESFDRVNIDIDVVRGAARLARFVFEETLLYGYHCYYAPHQVLRLLEAFYATGSKSIELYENYGYIYARDGGKTGLVAPYIPAGDMAIIDLYANDLM
jgi:hypothetical protein